MFHCEKIKLPSEEDVANKKNTRAVFLKKIDNAQLFRLLFLLHLSLYLDITILQSRTGVIISSFQPLSPVWILYLVGNCRRTENRIVTEDKRKCPQLLAGAISCQ